MPYTNTSGIVYDSGDFAQVTEECLKLADHKGFERAATQSKKKGKLRGWGMAYFLEEAGDLQRAHGPALRSERPRHHRRRHAFARPGPRHRLCADGVRMARRSVRQHPLHPGRHQRSADRPRHLRLAQHDGRRQCAASAPPTRSSRRRSRWRRNMLEASAGDLEFKDGKFKRGRHRQGDPTAERGEGLLRADVPAATTSASVSKRPARLRRSRRAIRTAATPARSRSIRRPASSTSCATPRSTMSAR